MEKSKKIVLAIALLQTPKIGDITAKKLVLHYDGIINLYHAVMSNYLDSCPIQLETFKGLFTVRSLEFAEKQIDLAMKHQLNWVYFEDEEYPKLLKECPDAPLFYYQDGGLDLSTFNRVISVVGTRKMTSYGKAVTQNLMEHLAPYKPLVVSGFALGVDICAHLSALENGMDTLAVLAHGFGTLYPKTHRKYYAQVKESAGFISEFHYNEAPLRENFLKRNRIVAGLSQATIIIESPEKGGSLVTADIADSYHRDVYSVPNDIRQPQSKGCLHLIQNHKAKIYTSAQQLIQDLGWEEEEITTQKNELQTSLFGETVEEDLFLELNEVEKSVVQSLQEKPRHIDLLCKEIQKPISEIATVLFQLELKGLIKALPGKIFRKA